MSITIVPATISYSGLENHSAALARRSAGTLFTMVNGRSKINAFIQRLLGRDNELKDLGNVTVTARRQANRNAAVVNVPLNKIVGSEGRIRDFDRKFKPLSDHLEERWIGIATARTRGIPLPPVQLIQVGDEYYVRDGNHRVSVAHAMGQAEIEAQIVYAVEAGLA